MLLRRNDLDMELYEYAKAMAYADILREGIRPQQEPPSIDYTDHMFKLFSQWHSSKTSLTPLIAKALHAPWKDTAGSGGETVECKYMGPSNLNKCQRLLLSSEDCGALTFVDGGCYLHDVTNARFKVVEKQGAKLQLYHKHVEKQRTD